MFCFCFFAKRDEGSAEAQPTGDRRRGVTAGAHAAVALIGGAQHGALLPGR